MSDYTKFKKGSEWRKWDLHVHTPFTTLNNQYPVAEDVWDVFSDEIEKSDVCVFGITDYFSVKNYFIFIEKHKIKYPNSKKIFFPNIELRLEVSVNSNAEEVNLHIVFDNKIAKDKLDLFLSKLNTNISSHGAIISCKELSSKNDFEKAGIDYKILRKTLKEVFGKSQCFLIFAASNNTGLRPDNNSPRKLNITDEIDKICDGFFGGLQNVDYFLDKNRYEDDEKAKQKPVISGCDAHSFEELKKYLGKRFIRQSNDESIIEKDITWIKSNPVFEGLKQIVYEPKDRIKIQENNPNGKNNYEIINKVCFVDKTENKDFSDEWIEMNPELNSIIGGKSSGKSLLLYHIAKTINPLRLEEINKDSPFNTLKYHFEDDSNFDFYVEWCDGHIQKLSEISSEVAMDWNSPILNDYERYIEYIPQLYLNRLAEEKKAELYSVVEDILYNKSAYKEFRDSVKSNITAIQKELSAEIVDIFSNLGRLNYEKEARKLLGDEDAIGKSIDEIAKRIENLKNDSQFTEIEIEEYSKLAKKNMNNIEETEFLIKQKNIFIDLEKGIQNFTKEALLQDISSLKNEIIMKYQPINEPLNQKIDTITDNLYGVLTNAINYFCVDILTQKENQELILKNETEKKDIDKQLKPYVEKIKNKSEFEKEQKNKIAEEEKIKAIKTVDSKIKEIRLVLNKTFENMRELYKKLFECYQVIVEENKKHSHFESSGIEITSNIAFNSKNLGQNFSEKISKNTSLGSQFGISYFTGNNFIFSEESHANNIISILHALFTDNSIALNKGYSLQNVVEGLLGNYFSIEYDLIQNGDKLLLMSPGKRGLILFQLYLHLSNSTSPILIDQPEDSLDNRTVYSQLNGFIKKNKIQRQIIIVSHNPNLVVSTDSENIIVANQNGQNKDAKNKNYKFEYVNGSLEHTFEDCQQDGILYQKGIREHVCEILEGGKEAFEKRENKYGFGK